MNSATLWVTFVLKKCQEAENSRITDAVCSRDALRVVYVFCKNELKALDGRVGPFDASLKVH